MTTSKMILTDWFKSNYDTITWDGSQQVKVVLYSRSPIFSEDEATRFADIESASDLDLYPEWVKAQALLTEKTSVGGSPSSLYLTKITLDGSLEGLQVVDGGGIPVAVEDGAGWYIDTDPTQVIVASAV